MIQIDRHRSPPTCSRRSTASSRCRRRRSSPSKRRGGPRTGHRSSPSRAGTGRGGWTEWTQGFQFGSARAAVRRHRRRRPSSNSGGTRTVERMAPHLTHVGVHDHGFNNVSTYGNLWRLAREGRFEASPWEARLLRAGAEGERRGAGPPLDAPARRRLHLLVQRRRTRSSSTPSARCARSPSGTCWATTSWRNRTGASACSSGWCSTPRPTARYSVFYGEGRDRYDLRGRTAHEFLFNVDNGSVRGPSSQQGYSPVQHVDARPRVGDARVRRGAGVHRDAAGRGTRALRRTRRRRGDDARRRRAPPATATSRTRAPMACRTGTPARQGWHDWRLARSSGRPVQRRRTGRQLGGGDRRAGPAAASAAAGRPRRDRRRRRATSRPACARARHALRRDGPYLSTDPGHQGLLLHSVYHWPNGWDHVPAGLAFRAASRACGATTTLREARALREAAGRRRALSHVLRPERSARAPARRSAAVSAATTRTALVTGGTRGIGLGSRGPWRAKASALVLCGQRAPAPLVQDVLSRAAPRRAGGALRRRRTSRAPARSRAPGRGDCASVSAPSTRSSTTQAGTARPRRPARRQRGELRGAACTPTCRGRIS